MYARDAALCSFTSQMRNSAKKRRLMQPESLTPSDYGRPPLPRFARSCLRVPALMAQFPARCRAKRPSIFQSYLFARQFLSVRERIVISKEANYNVKMLSGKNFFFYLFIFFFFLLGQFRFPTERLLLF
ncbi:hypothetical protein PUN28_005457 [Cardiocondyla obscurior]|uniref:Uncharacterized protein n=1 Tax=Cardiocondyla obscurior TaxID=286306 RepID=A0AAW2GIY0_9HYME